MIPEPAPEVVQAARRGDREAFRALVEILMGATYAIARRMTRDGHEAEDLTQEIFLKLHSFVDRYDPSLPFAPWYRKLAVRVGLNYVRGAGSPGSLPDGLPAADSPARDADLGASVRRGLAALPPQQRAAVSLYYLEGRDVAEVADALEVPPGTVKTWLFRAREALRTHLGGFAP